MKYFQTQLVTAKVDGIEYDNIQLITSVCDGTNLEEQGYVKVPSGYEALDVLGYAYFPNEEVPFKKIERPSIQPIEPTQLDRMESDIAEIKTGSTQLLEDIRTETIDQYTLELVESGLL